MPSLFIDGEWVASGDGACSQGAARSVGVRRRPIGRHPRWPALETAVDNALTAAFVHSGQVCSAGCRAIVQDEIHDAFVDAIAARAERIRLGPGTDPATETGALISAEHRAKVEARVVFGPVLTIERFTTEDEGRRPAPCGDGVDQRLQRLHPAGGVGRIQAVRELGPSGLDEYREAKHILQNTAPGPTGWFGG